jgi:hypothetical protein
VVAVDTDAGVVTTHDMATITDVIRIGVAADAIPIMVAVGTMEAAAVDTMAAAADTMAVTDTTADTDMAMVAINKCHL